MRVRVCQSVDIDTEVNIGTEEIREQLLEMFQQCQNSIEFEMPTREVVFKVRSLIGAAHSVLSALTPEMIDHMPMAFREVAANALRGTAERFLPRLGEAGD